MGTEKLKTGNKVSIKGYGLTGVIARVELRIIGEVYHVMADEIDIPCRVFTSDELEIIN